MTRDRRTRTLLVTGAAGPAGRALGVQLSAHSERSQLRVLGVDLAPKEVLGIDAMEVVPAARDAAYERTLLELVARHEPDLIIPTVSEELPGLAVLGGAVGLGRRLVLSDAAPTAVAADKLLTMWALDHRGVPVPRYAGADEFASSAEALSWAGGPVVVKPRQGRGGRGVHVVERAGDPVWAVLDASWVVQLFAPGAEYSPQVYRSPVTGRCVVVVLEKSGRKQGRVGNATEVTRLPQDAAKDVAELSARVVQALDLVGPVDMDVRRLGDGTPVVLEVNSRFGAVSADAPELLDAVLHEWPG
ncbi:ATP-grasp domain-containing protein [Nocardioides houyundeii]|uniref:ATP-grasp domain-containing protein n=1 Tax=Nocardioides houyundeii TaxID=2045452 RepID=UPI000DF2C70F|nr:ATP-grasp domain-containing protein [Nocardioides houyundeii]